MALDIYIYLKGGRGDGFVPGWDGTEPTTEGTFDNTTGVMSDEGREVGEPYRDIFQQGGQPFSVRQMEEINVGEGAPVMYNAEKPFTLPQGSVYYATGVSKSFWHTYVDIENNAGGPITNGGAAIEADLEVSNSDDLAHTKPRLFTKVCSWLVFTAEAGVFKFRKADVIGWGGRARTD